MGTVCLLSGGLDSLVMACKISQEEPVYCLSFDYGQRHRRELLAADNIRKSLGFSGEVVDLRGFSWFFKGSSLTGGGEVPFGHYEDESMRSTVVPNRNMVFLSLATSFAISNGFDSVAFACHSGDHVVYPDCRPEFCESVAKCLSLADYRKITLKTPFVNFRKEDIVELGKSINCPMSLSWSCYVGGDKHCGKCGTCVERKEAFARSGVVDETEYEEEKL